MGSHPRVNMGIESGFLHMMLKCKKYLSAFSLRFKYINTALVAFTIDA